MDHEFKPLHLVQAVGRVCRLRRELDCARSVGSRRGALIDRLKADLVEAQDTIATFRPLDEQCGEPLLSYATVVLMPTMDEAV